MIYMSIFHRIKIEAIMSDQLRLIHLSPDGPYAEGLSQLDLEPNEFQSPFQCRMHIFFMRMLHLA